MFEEVLDDFADFYRAHKLSADPRFEEAAGLEVQRRLRHLDYLLAEVTWRWELIRLDLDRGDLSGDSSDRDEISRRVRLATGGRAEALSKHGLLEIEVSEQIEGLAESFYFHAHRVLKLLQRGPLPGFASLKAAGILKVRNQLIEHFPQRGKPWPQHHARDFSDEEAGPKLTKATDPVADAGLFHNARELRDAIAATLQALPRTPAPPDSPGTFGGARWTEERDRRLDRFRPEG